MKIINDGIMDDENERSYNDKILHGETEYHISVKGRTLSEFNRTFYCRVTVNETNSDIEFNGTFGPDADSYIWEASGNQLPNDVINKVGLFIEDKFQ